MFDHDVSFLVEYENGDRPQAVLEKGNPEAGKLFSFSIARDFQKKITLLKSRAIYDNGHF